MRADEPDAVPLAGGTDLLVDWPARDDAHAKTYVDLSRLAELARIVWEEDALVLGAGTTFWDVRRDPSIAAELPILAEVAGRVGVLQVQTRGTWVGNLVTGSRYADAAAALRALDAEVEWVAPSGATRAPLDEDGVGLANVLRDSRALVRAVRIPRRRFRVAVFEKLGLRAANTRSILNLTALESEGRWRIVVGGATPRAVRCRRLEARLASGDPVDRPDDLVPEARSDLFDSDAEPAEASYRERVVARLLATRSAETHPRIRGNL
jgi:CO/xanthine dehydrogenase FAD-binding subunit